MDRFWTVYQLHKLDDMIMFYLDTAPDFMHSFYRSFLAKQLVDLLAPIDNPVKLWTTNNNNLQLDALNKFVLIDGIYIFRYDFIWIENIDRFLRIEVSPGRHIKPGLVHHSWKIDGELINLFLFPWTNFPVWENITTP